MSVQFEMVKVLLVHVVGENKVLLVHVVGENKVYPDGERKLN
jgi:hypothetical protein